MGIRSICAASVLSILLPPTAGADFLPPGHSPETHRPTWENPPFSRELLRQTEGTAAEAREGTGWHLTALDFFDGEYTIGVTTKKNEFLTLKVGVATPDGIWVSRVESNGILRDAVVYITDGRRTERIRYRPSHRLPAIP